MPPSYGYYEYERNSHYASEWKSSKESEEIDSKQKNEPESKTVFISTMQKKHIGAH